MSISEAMGRAVGTALGALVMAAARPAIWLIHRPTERGEV